MGVQHKNERRRELFPRLQGGPALPLLAGAVLDPEGRGKQNKEPSLSRHVKSCAIGHPVVGSQGKVRVYRTTSTFRIPKTIISDFSFHLDLIFGIVYGHDPTFPGCVAQTST